MFRRSLSGFGMRGARGRHSKKVRRKVAGSFEEPSARRPWGRCRTHTRLLFEDMRRLCMIFGIYAMLMYTVQVYALHMRVDFGRFLTGE